jgi:hypothetical protein
MFCVTHLLLRITCLDLKIEPFPVSESYDYPDKLFHSPSRLGVSGGIEESLCSHQTLAILHIQR